MCSYLPRDNFRAGQVDPRRKFDNHSEVCIHLHMPSHGTGIPYHGTQNGRITGQPVAASELDAKPSAVDKVLSVLAAFRDTPTWTLGELAAAQGLPKSTTHRLIQSLIRAGFVQQLPDSGAYALGPSTWALAGRLTHEGNLRSLAIPALRKLQQLSGESAFLTAIDGTQSRCLARVNAEHDVSMLIAEGAANPLYTGASNTVLLAFLPEIDRLSCLREVLPDPSEREEVEVRLAVIRDEGYAYSAEELTVGAAALGVPVWGPGGEPIAGISLGAPIHRLSKDRALRLLPLLLQASQEVSERLGHVQPKRSAD